MRYFSGTVSVNRCANGDCSIGFDRNCPISIERITCADCKPTHQIPPITKEAIPAILAAKGYWGHSMRQVERLIQSHGEKLTGKKLHARADHYLAEICILYYHSLPPIALAKIRDTIIRSLTSTTPIEVLQYFYRDAADYSLKVFRSNPFLHQRTAHLTSCSAVAGAAIKRAETTFWLRGQTRSLAESPSFSCSD